MNALLALVSILTTMTLVGTTETGDQAGEGRRSAVCYPAQQSPEHALPPGTRLFVRPQMTLDERKPTSLRRPVLAEQATIDGTIANGKVAFDNEALVVENGVPLHFSVEVQVCAVPPGAVLPSFLTEPPLYTVP